MRVHDEARQKTEWRILHDKITEALDRFGKKDACGRGDYWLVDEDWGDYRHKLEVQNLDFLQPHIVMSLQSVLVGYPDWEIMFRVDAIGQENEWPAMGLIIQDDQIIDDLRREFLPRKFQDVKYGGRVSKPHNPFGT
jgi:hypothetical protein